MNIRLGDAVRQLRWLGEHRVVAAWPSGATPNASLHAVFCSMRGRGVGRASFANVA